MRMGALEYLSKLNNPDAGAAACTARGASSIASTVGTAGCAAVNFALSSVNRGPEM
jgi:hypothetical protein